jgi:hypothetical protein
MMAVLVLHLQAIHAMACHATMVIPQHDGTSAFSFLSNSTLTHEHMTTFISTYMHT